MYIYIYLDQIEHLEQQWFYLDLTQLIRFMIGFQKQYRLLRQRKGFNNKNVKSYEKFI